MSSQIFKPRAIAIGTAVTVCLYISGLLVIFTPLPIIYLLAASGRKTGVAAALMSFALVAVCYSSFFTFTHFDPASFSLPLPALSLAPHFPSEAVLFAGICYFLFYLTIGLFVGFGFLNRWGFVKSGTYALAFSFAVPFVMALIFKYYLSVHVLTALSQYLEYIIAQVASLQEAANVSDAKSAFLALHGKEIALFILNVSPALVFVFAILSVAVNLSLSKKLVRNPELVWDLTSFRLPDSAIWLVIFSAFAVFAGRYLTDIREAELIGVNALIILAAVYFFQGIAVAASYLKMIKSPMFRISIYVFIVLFFQMMALVIIGLGIADVWVDFRGRLAARRGPLHKIQGG